MPNSYATVPNILPGNVTVGGNLTVAGRSFVLGSATRKFRIQEETVNALFTCGFNRDVIAGADDDGAKGHVGWRLDLVSADQHTWAEGAPGVGYSNVLVKGRTLPRFAVVGMNPFCAQIGAQESSTQVTGTVAETTAYTHGFFSGEWSALGLILVEARFRGVVQGAVATTFRLKLAGTTLISFTKAAASNIVWRSIISTNGATNSELWTEYRIDGATVTAPTQGTGAISLAGAPTLTLTIQPGAATDNWFLDHVAIAGDPGFNAGF